ncbi:hypothetical protein BsWGS_13677 [Bradybaena similaris]
MEVCLLVASVLVGFLTASEGCSPPIGEYVPTSLEDKVTGSHTVVHGVVLSAQRDTRHTGGDAYSVKFEVRCVYKGAPVDRIIHIDEVGHIPGHCTATNLTVGLTYLVYLHHSDQGRFRPSFVQDPADEEYLEEVIFCDSLITYPTGYNENNTNYKCPDPIPKADCELNVVATDRVPADTENPGHSQETTGYKCTNPLTNAECEPNAPPTDNVPDDSENSDKAVVAGPSKENNGNNHSTALTWHLITLLLASSIFLL